MIDSRSWEEIGAQLRRSRLDAGLTLGDIGLLGSSQLSRMERGLIAPTPALIRQYIAKTGSDRLLGLLMRFEGDAYERTEQSPQPTTRVNSNLDTAWSVEELDTTIRIGERTTVEERRTIRSNVEGLANLRHRQTLFEGAATPKMLSIEAIKARISGMDWLARRYLNIDVELPSPLGVGDEHKFSILYELDFIYPRYTFAPLIQAQDFNLTIQFPSRAFAAFDCDALPPVLADDYMAALAGNTDHGMPRIDLDRFNCVQRRYSGISIGLIYGIMWVEEASMEPHNSA